jgi:hypothetical protein
MNCTGRGESVLKNVVLASSCRRPNGWALVRVVVLKGYLPRIERTLRSVIEFLHGSRVVGQGSNQDVADNPAEG